MMWRDGNDGRNERSLHRPINDRPTNDRPAASAGASPHLIEHLLQVGRFDEAGRLAADGLRQLPDSAPLLLALARAQQGQGDFRAASDAARASLRVEPGNSFALIVLSEALSNDQQAVEALAVAQSAIQMSPHYPDAYGQCATVLLRAPDELGAQLGIGKHQVLTRALTAADQAIALDPNQDRFHVARARALLQLMHADEARAAADRALELNPSNAEAIALLSVLDQVGAKPNRSRQRVVDALTIDPQSRYLQKRLASFTTRRLWFPVWAASVPGTVSWVKPDAPSVSVAQVAGGVVMTIAAIGVTAWWWSRLAPVERRSLDFGWYRCVTVLAAVTWVFLIPAGMTRIWYRSPVDGDGNPLRIGPIEVQWVLAGFVCATGLTIIAIKLIGKALDPLVRGWQRRRIGL